MKIRLISCLVTARSSYSLGVSKKIDSYPCSEGSNEGSNLYGLAFALNLLVSLHVFGGNFGSTVNLIEPRTFGSLMKRARISKKTP